MDYKWNGSWLFSFKVLVCNYGPGGNNSGMENDVYKQGPPGSECPKGSTKTSQGLCKHNGV